MEGECGVCQLIPGGIREQMELPGCWQGWEEQLELEFWEPRVLFQADFSFFFMEGLDSVRFPSQDPQGRAAGMGIVIWENSSPCSPIPNPFPLCFSHPRKMQENGV